jgi:hypothetical protein
MMLKGPGEAGGRPKAPPILTAEAGVGASRPTGLPERRARYFWDGNRNEIISRVEVVFARFIDDPDEAVAVSPSVGDLPVDFSDLEGGAIAPVAHT